MTFDSPTVPLVAKAMVNVRIEPGGPNFEVKLHGTAVKQLPEDEG